MAILVSIVMFVILAAAITYFGYRRYARPGQVYEQLGGKATYVEAGLSPDVQAGPGLVVSVFEQIAEKVPLSPEDVSLLRRDLMCGGFRSENAVAVYIGTRVLLIAGLVIAALLLRPYVSDQPAVGIILPVLGGILGYFGPSVYLDSRISRRHETLRLSLPDALDLMVVSVEAGLGLDQAIQYVARELAASHPELCWELQAVNNEIRAGARRPDALHHLADRTGEPEIRKLVAVLVQTDKFGTSVAESLRTHSDFMRVRRRQEAEERANKVGVKLVFPIFFLILPAMLVVAAGPGLLQVFKYLFPLMRNYNGL